MPHQLNFLDGPIPEPHVWEQLTDEQRTTVIDSMARIMRKAVVPTTTATTDRQEKIDD